MDERTRDRQRPLLPLPRRHRWRDRNGLSAIAALGAAAALITAPRGGDGTAEQTLLLRIAFGAAAAVALTVLAAGAGSAIATSSWQWFGITCWVAIVTATISGVSATATTAIFRYRPSGRP